MYLPHVAFGPRRIKICVIVLALASLVGSVAVMPSGHRPLYANDIVSGLTVDSDNEYRIVEGGLNQGAQVYTDRVYEFTEMPDSFLGAAYIQTANDDKFGSGDSFLTLSVSQNVIVYVAYDVRATALPDWLSGWVNIEQTLGTTDVNRNLYAKNFLPGLVVIGGNYAKGAAGAESNYNVIVTNPNLATISARNRSIGVGDSVAVPIKLNHADNGVSGFSAEITVSNPSIARITSVELPDFGITQVSAISDSSVRILVADVNRLVEPGSEDILLASVLVEGVSEGITSINPVIEAMDDDDGDPLYPEVNPGFIVMDGSNSFSAKTPKLAIVFVREGSNTPSFSVTVPVEDAFVRGGIYAAENFGHESRLTVKLASPTYTRESFLRFDLTGISGTVTEAKLVLIPISVGTADGFINEAALVADDNWTENGINWNSKPSSEERIGSWIPVRNEPVVLDVTFQARNELSGDGKFSIRVHSPLDVGPQGWANYGSKERVD